VTADLLAAFERLTPDQRAVLPLRIIGNLTLEETSRILCRRVGAVKALQRRALLALQEVLEFVE
jgi:RNA polymerase sigma-70 factor (ECF subfamily)